MRARRTETFPLAEHADPWRHPLLSRAAANQRPATTCKIEWLGEDAQPEVNYLEIFRRIFKNDGTERGKWFALERILDDIERALWVGVPRYNPSDAQQIARCGGVRHYLGRDPLETDEIALRVLLDCTLLLRDDNEGGEFLAEVSLEVKSARPVRRPAAIDLESLAA